jgi:hypothetical protein
MAVEEEEVKGAVPAGAAYSLKLDDPLVSSNFDTAARREAEDDGEGSSLGSQGCGCGRASGRDGGQGLGEGTCAQTS